jgi:DNA repair exonuclease SbcCD ATPase subunit
VAEAETKYNDAHWERDELRKKNYDVEDRLGIVVRRIAELEAELKEHESIDEATMLRYRQAGRNEAAERIAELEAALSNERAQPRYGCLGCPMVDGKCPNCGNELMP